MERFSVVLAQLTALNIEGYPMFHSVSQMKIKHTHNITISEPRIVACKPSPLPQNTVSGMSSTSFSNIYNTIVHPAF